MESSKKEDQELPDGWVLCKSKSIPGRNYYFNKKTGKSSWTQPQESKDDDESSKKPCKKEKLLKKQDKRKREDVAKNVSKRKSDGFDEGTSKKKSKQDGPEAPSISSVNKESPKQNEKKRKVEILPQCTSTPKRIPLNSTLSKSSPSKKKNASFEGETLHKHTPKNAANARLSHLRSMLNSEVKKEEESDASSCKIYKASPKTSEIPQKSRTERKSPLNDSKSAQSPSSDSLQSIPSPSQFFAANKIISSMKAQLPEEYCNKEKQKDTFADIERGIYSQTSENPFSKHPVTPPQFSEASKLVSAIKSKLAYRVSSSKDVKIYGSAKERMDSLRSSISLESDCDERSFLYKSADLNPLKNNEAMEVEDINPFGPVMLNIPFPVHKENMSSTDDVILVVDTNIFIHELDFIKTVLNSHIKGYSEQPTLLVPWRVINELDRLKDNNNGNGALCKRAKAAMDYLYKSLPENSRIKGQSLRDANSHIYPCEVPDDEILNCSLQQVERGRNVILVSNDKNLCNKASINGVKRIDVRELKALVESKPQPSDPGLLASVKRYQQTIYHLLANILENEMRAKYNNLWQHVLFKAPPWTLADVLQCLLKHWIAVFNEVFPRIEQLISDLKNSLVTIEKKNPNTLTKSEVANFKELCMDVAKRCQIIPEYMELAKATVERLSRNGGEADSTEVVVNAFEGLWTVFSSYCAKLSNALGVPNSIEDKLSGSEPLPVLKSKWPLFSGHITDLTHSINSVLSTQSTESLEEPVRRLELVFKDALSTICMSNSVTRDELHTFCIKCRNMLQEACNKFTHLSEILNVCKSRLSGDMN